MNKVITKKHISILLICIYVFTSYFSNVVITTHAAYKQSTVTITRENQVVDSFLGVDAVYMPYKTNEGSYSCAGYVHKFYNTIYGMSVSNLTKDATPICSGHSVKRISNPRVGDIGSQTSSSGNTHWFIVKAVNGNGSYTVIEQNWSWTDKPGKFFCNVNRTVNSSTEDLRFFRILGTWALDGSSPTPSPDPVCAGVTINQESFIGGKRITFTTSEPGASIVYRTDDFNWSPQPNGFSRELSESVRVRAYATKSDYMDSAVTDIWLTINKLTKPNIATRYVDNGIMVEMSSPEGAEIHYTTDGSTPTANSARYSGGFVVGSSANVKAIAVAAGWVSSDVTQKNITAAKPGVPSVSLYNTEDKIALGDTASVSWTKLNNASSYTVSLYKDNALVEEKTTSGTLESFVLDKLGGYTIRVKAKNFAGTSDESYPPVVVTTMNDVTVDFVDYDGKTISTQTVKYAHEATAPFVPQRKGYTFSGWDSVAYKKATENIKINATYEINRYSVSFYDVDGTTLLSTQKIEYLSSATPPDSSKCTIKDNYIFSGWHVDYTSSGDDYTAVEGDMKLVATQSWENKDLPIVLSVNNCYRDDNGKTYSANIHIINSNLGTLNYKLIGTLKAANGKTLKSVITEEYSDSAVEKDIDLTINYTDKASSFEVVAVGYDGDFKTGGTVSKVATSAISARTNVYWGDWSEWTETKPVNNGGSNVSDFQVESKTQYRGRTKAYADSYEVNPAGWTSRTDCENPTVQYGEWSGIQDSTTYPTPSDCCELIEQYNVYNYYHYCHQYTKGGAWKVDSISYGYNDTLHFLSVAGGLPYHQISDKGGYKSYGPADASYCSHGKQYWWPVGTHFTSYDNTINTHYKFRTRSKSYLYHYWKWNNWTDWQDDNPGGDEVQQRTLYRSRYQYTDNISNPNAGTENAEGKEYTISGKLANVTKNFANKVATVMVYKKTNSDPTEEQLEYVNQITIGDDNSYSFTFIPREEISEFTGDYIIALGLEGGDKPVNVDVIKAPTPEHTVTFMSEGEIISTQTVKDGENAVVPKAPEKDGYYFEKWNENITNITSDMTISAVYKKNDFSIVFVDFANNTINIENHFYGDVIDMPVLDNTEGKTFAGWDGTNESTYTVTDNKVFTAKWDKATYTVKFVDNNNNVISEQKVEYGQAAQPPTDLSVAGYVFEGWNLGSCWWCVTQDITVAPILKYEKTVEAPVYTHYATTTGENVLLFESSTPNSEIYYTLDGTEPDETSELYDPEDGIFFEDDITVCCYAVCDGYNDSDVEEINLAYTDKYNCTVFFEPNNGTEIEEIALLSGDTISEPATPTKKGYKFAGWYIDYELTEKFDFSQAVYGDVVLYAKWTDSTDVDPTVVYGDANNNGVLSAEDYCISIAEGFK